MSDIVRPEELEWTGERYLPRIGGGIELEHLHRYFIAKRFAVGKRVLDIASGEGYGSALLASSAQSVVGVDISSDAIGFAQEKYRLPNLDFKVGSCAAIPLPDHSVDLVVSFETIEHHDQHHEMMQEIKRVLSPDGVLLISSPDKLEYSDRTQYKNPFHLKELYREEFEGLLNEYFRSHYLMGQRVVYGSAIVSESVSSQFLHGKPTSAQSELASGLQQATYLIAIAGDETLPPGHSSLLEQDVMESDAAQTLAGQISNWSKHAQSLEQHLASAEASLAQAIEQRKDSEESLRHAQDWQKEEDRQLSESLQRLSALTGEPAAQTDRGAALNAQLAVLQPMLGQRARQIQELEAQLARINTAKDADIRRLSHELAAVLNSRSWRLTSPYRKAMGLVKRSSTDGQRGVPAKIVASIRNRKLLLSNAALERLRTSTLFDAQFYLDANSDVKNAGADPATHYLLHGWREGRNPSKGFSTSGYLAANPDVRSARVNPLLHYIEHGLREGRSLGLQSADPALTGGLVPAAEHTVQVTNPRAAPHPTHGKNVSVSFRQNEEKILTEIAAIKESGLFDQPFYLSMYADQESILDPIRHYCEVGWKMGFNPSDDFDTNYYLGSYSDIRAEGINPFWHYVVAGAIEQRTKLPESLVRFEDDIQFRTVQTDIQLLAFYEPAIGIPSPEPSNSATPLPLAFGDSDAIHLDSRPSLSDQAELARRHGFAGFCFALKSEPSGDIEAPALQQFLNTDSITFGLCVQFRLDQSAVPDIRILLTATTDSRYMRIDKRPIVLLQLSHLESETAISIVKNLRDQIFAHCKCNPYLVGCWPTSMDHGPEPDLRKQFDAALDFSANPVPGETGDFKPIVKNDTDFVPYPIVASKAIERARAAKHIAQPTYQTVTLGRTNFTQTSGRPITYSRFHLNEYRRWLDAAIEGTRNSHPEDRRFLFVNGWNKWREGLFLEPDRRSGYSKLNETTRALLAMPSGMSMPKVSIIVPNYNHHAFLRRRLTSIYGQTYRNFEVILLDDCSADESRSVLNEYATAYPTITRTIFNEVNSGSPFRQWAKGIKAARGDLVWIAESDDFCDSNFLETLVRCFDDEAVLLASAKCIFVDRDGRLMRDEFRIHLGDLACADKWSNSYVETAHNEVVHALSIKNTLPNASGVLFKRPVEMPLLEDESWLSMRVAGDWVFYLHLIRGGKIAYSNQTGNYFRRYEGSTAEATYRRDIFYREVSSASRTAAALYDVPASALAQCRNACKALYDKMVANSDAEFDRWYDFDSVVRAKKSRLPSVMVSTMGFYPGGAEILPIRLANEFKRQGLSVLLLSAGLNPREDGVRRMLRNDVPVVETSSIAETKTIIREFGIEALNTHQWHIQKYPFQVPDVFSDLRCHVASLHGMIEHGDAFGVTPQQLTAADKSVTTWVYTADKNLGPFAEAGLLDGSSPRFVKLPNGIPVTEARAVVRADLGIPDDAFTLCCVSRAIVDKGWDETIRVVDRARSLSRKDIRLILVGNGPVYDDYCKTGVPDFVHLIGFSDNSFGHYAASDMGIMLTKFKSESFPLTIVDCLFAGKPYIATDVGEIRHMLTESDRIAGEVIALDDWEIPIEIAAKVVQAFATDRVYYEQALSQVTKISHRYRIDVVASQYVRLFQGTDQKDSGNTNPSVS